MKLGAVTAENLALKERVKHLESTKGKLENKLQSSRLEALNYQESYREARTKAKALESE